MAVIFGGDVRFNFQIANDSVICLAAAFQAVEWS